MEKNSLDKDILDKVRDIEGFPIGDDEDIIELSDPPYYTACPNPGIVNFIKKHGHLYDPKTDDYHREPFTSDVSEGKNDPIYNAHSYQTKIPPNAILPHILHYTKPGDIIFDGFCGSGMVGVATASCKDSDSEFKKTLEKENKIKFGQRSSILSDISTIATLSSYIHNKKIDQNVFYNDAKKIVDALEQEYEWMFETQHVKDDIPQFEKDVNGDKSPIIGKIRYTVWSDIFTCPECSNELVIWEVMYDKNGNPKKQFQCNNCKKQLIRKDLNHVWESVLNSITNEIIKIPKQIPVLIKYSMGDNFRVLTKKPDSKDLKIIKKISEEVIGNWYPTNEIPKGDKTNEPKKLNFNYVYQIFSKRNLLCLSFTYKKILEMNSSEKLSLLGWFTSSHSRLHKFNTYLRQHNRHVGPLPGTLYISGTQAEISPVYFLKEKLKDFSKINHNSQQLIVSTQSNTDLSNILSNSIDYIFTDPPFGDNLMYSELNFMLESWLKVFTNNKNEAIMNKSQRKDLAKYQELMEFTFKENYRILKPNRWMTIVFHNSQNKVWMAIQEAIQRAGFIVADVRVLDKKKGTINQISYSSGAVKQDLVISTYKPSGVLDEYFVGLSSGTEEGVWKFIDSHLKQLPLFVEKNQKVEMVIERQKFLLFDRMIAFHVQKGFTVPISASEFYEKLHQKYPERDGMYFLAEQIPEYDQKRAQTKSIEQTTIFVEDEKSTILWLDEQLKTPQTYQNIQPKFLKEIHQNKFEKLPELSEILEQNFLQDGKNKWYIPDPSQLKDLEKLREKSLLREFKIYEESKGKLKQFRLEAIRVGFQKNWSEDNYKSIVDVAKRLPEQIIQEDSNLLMYYDNAMNRV